MSSEHCGPLSIVNVPTTLPAGVSYDADTHSFVLDPSDAAYQSLAAGETQNVTVNYGVSDGTATTDASASFTITGAADVHIVRGDPNVNFENLYGHTGETDVFVWDAANIPSTLRYDYIYGFETGLDKIAYVNVSDINSVPLMFNVNSSNTYNNDPAIVDGDTDLQVPGGTGATHIAQLIAITIDVTPQLSDVAVYNNDPFLIA